METPLPTVTITTDNGPVIINAADYNADTHTLAEGQETPVISASEVDIAFNENGEPARIINEAGNAVDVNGTTMKTLDPAAQTGNVGGSDAPGMDGNTKGQMNAAGTGTIAPVADAAPPVQYFVSKTGSKHYVVDAAGTPVKGVAGIDDKGYKNEGEAWAAVTALAAA